MKTINLLTTTLTLCLTVMSVCGFSQKVKTKNEILVKKEISTAVKMQSEIIVNESEDFTWEEPDLVNKLGYKSITFKKGNYSIVKDKKYPYGKVMLDVIGGTKLNEKAEATINTRPIIFPCHLAGGRHCDKWGFRCLVMRRIYDYEKVSFTPIIKNNKLVQLQLVFLSEIKSMGSAEPET